MRPDHMVAEILDGELVLPPRSALRHASVASNLAPRLITCSAVETGRDGWLRIVVPDLAGWRSERLPAVPSRSRGCADRVAGRDS
jgi:hypothetical protein